MPGRPRRIDTAPILQMVTDDPNISTRVVARYQGVSQATVCRALKSAHFHPYKIRLIQELHANDELHRLRYCRWFLDVSEENYYFSKYILFLDECTFQNNDNVNRHNSHYWVTENPHWMQQAHTFLNNELVALLDNVPLELRMNMWFQQDGHPAHTAKATRELLNEKFGNHWIVLHGPREWPPRSPDLTPLDFFLWSHIKQQIYTTQPVSVEDLKDRITHGRSKRLTPMDRSIHHCCGRLQNLTVDISSVSSTSSYSQQNTTLLEVFNKKASFENGGSRNIAITEALIVFMICKDNMPIRIAEREGFIHFFKTLCPLYKIPSRSTLTIRIEEKYKMCRSQLKRMLDQVHYISLTLDICTVMNSTRSFLVITGHFINVETFVLESVCLEAVHLTERHTADTIVEQFHEICKEFSLNSSKIASITIDGAVNMQKAVELFSNSSKWVWCFAHITNLVVQNSLKNTPELDKIILQIKRIVTYFKHSTIPSEELRAEQLKRGKSEGNILYLTQDICTRWNSTFEMLEKFEKLTPILATILASKDHKDSPQMLAGFHIEVVSEIISSLAPFKEATTQISGDKYVTASIVLPLCHNVLDTLNELKLTTNAAMELKKNLLKEIQIKYVPLERNKLLTIATLLDPRFKRVYSFSSLFQAEAISQICRKIREKTKEQDFLSVPERSPPKETKETSNSIWTKHTERLKNHLDEESYSSQIQPELKLYFKLAVQPLSEDPIKYWQNYKAVSCIGRSCLKILYSNGVFCGFRESCLCQETR
ncbi:zinc finger BED domain-containing protein 1 [Ooceraea biroi]|nr:zinc finger BED domain-containing protein 1 [Ooceraea biroi]